MNVGITLNNTHMARRVLASLRFLFVASPTTDVGGIADGTTATALTAMNTLHIALHTADSYEKKKEVKEIEF